MRYPRGAENAREREKNSREYKASIISRLLPPNNASMREVSEETDILMDTLYTWRLKYRSAHLGTVSQPGSSGNWDAEVSAEHAARTFRKSCLRKGISGRDLILHSDNGSPMKGATMLGTLQMFCVMPSFSRPSVSSDNACSKALFRTLKYRPGFPEYPFESIEQARKWAAGFVYCYNEEHRHTA